MAACLFCCEPLGPSLAAVIDSPPISQVVVSHDKSAGSIIVRWGQMPGLYTVIVRDAMGGSGSALLKCITYDYHRP